jgi:SWI/SNF-related matrix-associated actin-dependent regulator 1 of chromatin subfamily A
MLMRKKSEVMKELPPVFRQVIEVPCTDETKIETEWQAFNHYQQMLEGYRKAKLESTAGDTEGFRKRLSEMRQSVRIAFQDLARARHDCALYKLPAIVEHLRATAECNKCISFSHHKDLIAALRDAFPSSLSLLSEMNVTQRQAVLDRFNLTDDRLLLTSIRLGLGYNATGCHHVVFSELDWTPAIMAQCEARIHRKGQTENCLVQYIVLENSVDSMMARQLVQKQNVIDSFERRA